MNEEYQTEKANGTSGIVNVQTLDIQFMKLDLGSLKSSMEFVDAFKATGRLLHTLVCNAGIFSSHQSKEYLY
jgi:NAD(P)-dependent dehydrogenase (short-subunit alcohol dehydrogenase family)